MHHTLVFSLLSHLSPFTHRQHPHHFQLGPQVMSAHSRSGGSPSVRQLIARYQSMDSPSSLSPRPTFSSPRPTETLPPRRGRLGFAGEDQVSVEEPKIRLSLEALNCVLCHSDISGTRVVARSPSSSSDPDTFDSSDSEEDISPGSRLPRDETSSPPDRNIRKVSLTV